MNLKACVTGTELVGVSGDEADCQSTKRIRTCLDRDDGNRLTQVREQPRINVVASSGQGDRVTDTRVPQQRRVRGDRDRATHRVAITRREVSTRVRGNLV